MLRGGRRSNHDRAIRPSPFAGHSSDFIGCHGGSGLLSTTCHRPVRPQTDGISPRIYCNSPILSKDRGGEAVLGSLSKDMGLGARHPANLPHLPRGTRVLPVANFSG